MTKGNAIIVISFSIFLFLSKLQLVSHIFQLRERVCCVVCQVNNMASPVAVLFFLFILINITYCSSRCYLIYLILIIFNSFLFCLISYRPAADDPPSTNQTILFIIIAYRSPTKATPCTHALL